MITVYQELIPLSNKMYEKPISLDSTFTNPVIIPFVYNATGPDNVMEVVVYIRNDSQEHFYEDVVVTLMKESTGIPNTTPGILSISNSEGCYLSLNAASGSNELQLGLAYPYQQPPLSTVTINNQYKNTYSPLVSDDNVTVKFSYGYDELSHIEWDERKSAILIPRIGNPGMADLSYIPIRMRMTWKGTPTLFTIRNYFIDVSFSSEVAI
jgi:hypothetical protein